MLQTDLWEEGVAGDELLLSLASRARAAYGLDVSSAVVSAARGASACQEDPGSCADVRDIPLPSGAVDAVVSTSTLDHLEGGDQRSAAVAEIRRVLAPRAARHHRRQRRQRGGSSSPSRRHARRGSVPLGPTMSLTGLRDLVSAAGFTASDHAYVVHAPRVVATIAVRTLRRLPAGSDRALEKLLRSFEVLGRRAPRRLRVLRGRQGGQGSTARGRIWRRRGLRLRAS